MQRKFFGKILFIFAAAAVMTATAAFAAGTMSLYYGGVKKGDILSRANASGGTDIAVDEAVKALGLARTGNAQGIVVVMGGRKMEFWNNSGIVRVSNTIVSLPEPVSTSDGHWWIDSKSAKQVFDQFYYSIGRRNGISFMAGSAEPQTQPEPEKPAPAVKPAQQIKPAVKSSDKTQPKSNDNTPPKSGDKTQGTRGTKKAEVIPEQTSEPELVGSMEGITPEFKGKRRPIVVLDAGHGAHDPGASGNGVIEKNINLKAVLQLGDALKAYGVDVRYSRKTDVFLKLAERTAFANNSKADVFVSLHCNSLPRNSGRNVAGIEIYLMASPRDKDSLQLAIAENKEISGRAETVKDLETSDRKTRTLLKILGDMQQNNKISESTHLVEMLNKSVKSNGLPMRKVSQAPFFVLRGAGMPAVLIEMGYLTNPTEASKLTSPTYREELCRAIARGVVSYIKSIS